ncbi:hypothetical protein AA14337_3129 [Acetobacter malorum DSM 14337]|uniref:Uncharacterized protein n=1 Tax=Acetobacter malorum DSM 14337 TaxID=1307910 RepID=A0ABQ0PZS1_9PROT|nr:hypothetical protein AA14337_3129 [Acetobacter malorum DSM 14337]
MTAAKVVNARQTQAPCAYAGIAREWWWGWGLPLSEYCERRECFGIYSAVALAQSFLCDIVGGKSPRIGELQTV